MASNTSLSSDTKEEIEDIIQESSLSCSGDMNLNFQGLIEEIDEMLIKKVEQDSHLGSSSRKVCAKTIKEITQYPWQSPWLQYFMGVHMNHTTCTPCKYVIPGGKYKGQQCGFSVLPGHQWCGPCESYDQAHQEIKAVMARMVLKEE